MDEVRIQLRFWFDTLFGRFSDALYFTETEWAGIKPAAVDALKQKRVDGWVAHILATKDQKPTKESYQIELADIEARKAVLEEEIGKFPLAAVKV